MKILLVGEYYSDNLGDPLLCRVVEKTIRQSYPDARIIPFDMSGRSGPGEEPVPQTDPVLDWITGFVCKHFLYYRRAAICRAYMSDPARHLRVWYGLGALLKEHRFDLVVFAGGSVFMDYFAGVINLMVRRLAFSRAKILFHACGMSTLSEDGIYLLRQALGSRRVVHISLRDSYHRFRELFPVEAPVCETYDTALSCSRWYPAGKPRCQWGIGLIDRCRDQQLRLIRSCMDSGVQWQAFTNGSPYDDRYARALLLDAGIAEDELEKYLAPRPRTVEELIDTVTGFQRIAAFRMHSQIVAASFGIPSFGFVWDEKIRQFYEKLGFAQGCTSQETDLPAIRQVLEEYDGGIHPRALGQGARSQECLIDAIKRATAGRHARRGGA